MKLPALLGATLLGCLATAGCLNLADGHFACGAHGYCPAGQHCAADGRCYADPASGDRDGGANRRDAPASERRDEGLDGPGPAEGPPPRDASDLPDVVGSESVADADTPDQPPADLSFPDQGLDVPPPADGGCTPGTAVNVGDNTGDEGSSLDVVLDSANPDSRGDQVEPIQVGPTTNALMRFRLPPTLAGCTLSSAILNFHVNNGVSSSPVFIYVVSEDWDFFATWNYSGLAPWSVPGCDAAPCRADLPLFTLDPVLEGWVALALPVALVQQWLTDPSSNLGVLLTVAGKNADLEYTSNDGGDGTRPFLRLELQ